MLVGKRVKLIKADGNVRIGSMGTIRGGFRDYTIIVHFDNSTENYWYSLKSDSLFYYKKYLSLKDNPYANIP